MRNDKLIKMVYTAMSTAMIFILTRFFQFPVASGYIHLGDCLVYLVATTLGGPWAIFSAAIGEGLADLTSGFVIYCPFTIIIKGLIALLFVKFNNSKKILNRNTIIISIISGLITLTGYFFTDLIINKIYAFVNIPGNAFQAISSVILFIVIAFAFDKVNLKKKLFL